jgi:hypothetical protein
MTLPLDPVTVVVPIAGQAVACELPAPVTTLLARYVVMDSAAMRAGHRGAAPIRHPAAYVHRYLEPYIAGLVAGGPAAQAVVDQLEGRMAHWAARQSGVGPALRDIGDAIAAGALVDASGRVVARFERDPRALALLGILLGHPLPCGIAGCAVCAAARDHRWEAVLAATGTPAAVLRDLYTLALEAAWLPRLPNGLAAPRPPITRPPADLLARLPEHLRETEPYDEYDL